MKRCGSIDGGPGSATLSGEGSALAAEMVEMAEVLLSTTELRPLTVKAWLSAAEVTVRQRRNGGSVAWLSTVEPAAAAGRMMIIGGGRIRHSLRSHPIAAAAAAADSAAPGAVTGAANHAVAQQTIAVAQQTIAVAQQTIAWTNHGMA